MPLKGYKQTDEHRRKISEGHKGEKNYAYRRAKELREKYKYTFALRQRILNREKVKAAGQKRREHERSVPPPDWKHFQRVYEENIKKFGSLTCSYCLKKVGFGTDSIDHKTPISRGGTHDYENLAIACRSCNTRKRNRTFNEYQEWLAGRK